jgi:EmrB/QacA subfamily drug resistance transporter
MSTESIRPTGVTAAPERPHAAPTRAQVPSRRERLAASSWLPLPVVLAGTFMVVLDFFIVNVALPSIQARLHAGNSSVEWVVAGYALSSAVFMITAGRLGDRLGHRRVFTLGLAVFTLASAACGAAATPTELVLARLLQGGAAALLTPNVLSIIGVLYSGPHRLRALSLYSTTMGFAAAGGQLIGGSLIALNPAGLGWRTCFLINVPIGIAALVLAPRVIPASPPRADARLDLGGTVLITAALTALVLPLVEGRQHGWPAWTWISLAAAPALLAAFTGHQSRVARRGGSPLVDPALFRARSFSGGLVTQFCFWAGQASFFVVLALYLQQGRGLRPLPAGLVFTILAAAYLAASTAAPRLATRHGRAVILGGALMLGCGHLLLLGAVAEIGVDGSLAALAPGLLLVGGGMGLVLAPLAGTILRTLEPARAGAAAGMLTTVQNVGNALGVALTGVIFFAALHSGYAHAFELTAAAMALLQVGVAAASRLLPPLPSR